MNIQQLDGNISVQSSDLTGLSEDVSSSSPENLSASIPTIVTSREQVFTSHSRSSQIRYLKTVRRSNRKLKTAELPLLLCINPRSCYGKSSELALVISQYSADCITISESWSRDNYPLFDLINIPNYRVIMNVNQRQGRGGKPAIIVNENKYDIIEVCPHLVSVPVEVEAVWVVLRPKNIPKSSDFNFIAVCSYYYSDPKRTPRHILYDHMAESYNILTSKYGEKTHFILASDSNKLKLSPILDISSSFTQVVKVPTRLDPPAILDTIVTSLSKFYNEPITKPPLQNDPDNLNGKPSITSLFFGRQYPATLKTKLDNTKQ